MAGVSWHCYPIAALALAQAACTATSAIGDDPILPVQRAAEVLGRGATVVKPDGDGPFPVVVAFHGCGGNGPAQDAYARVARDIGVMTVIVDSHGPRDIGRKEALATVCSGLRLRGKERAGDVVAALEFVRALSAADDRRIVLLGWSHGAWSIMDAFSMNLPKKRLPGLDALPAEPFAGVQGAVLLYPYCGRLARTQRKGWNVDVPAQFILAAEDDVVGVADCIVAAEKLMEQGQDVDIEIITGQRHGFDEPEESSEESGRYDSQAAAGAHALFERFLHEHLRPGMDL